MRGAEALGAAGARGEGPARRDGGPMRRGSPRLLPHKRRDVCNKSVWQVLRPASYAARAGKCNQRAAAAERARAPRPGALHSCLCLRLRCGRKRHLVKYSLHAAAEHVLRCFLGAGGRMAREHRARAALAAALSIILKLRRPLRYGGAGALGGRTGQFMNSCPSSAPRPARLRASARPDTAQNVVRTCAPERPRWSAARAFHAVGLQKSPFGGGQPGTCAARREGRSGVHHLLRVTWWSAGHGCGYGGRTTRRGAATPCAGGRKLPRRPLRSAARRCARSRMDCR